MDLLGSHVADNSIVAMAAPRLAAWMRCRKGRGIVAAIDERFDDDDDDQ